MDVPWKIAAFSVLLAVFGALKIDGLRCYESNAMGNARSKNCSDCKYCVVAPAGLKPTDSVDLFGVSTENEELKSLKAFNGVFDLSSNLYNVLSMCVFEEYNWPALGLSQAVEYQFRCFCNYDNCNKASGLESFLNKLIINRAAKQGRK